MNPSRDLAFIGNNGDGTNAAGRGARHYPVGIVRCISTGLCLPSGSLTLMLSGQGEMVSVGIPAARDFGANT